MPERKIKIHGDETKETSTPEPVQRVLVQNSVPLKDGWNELLSNTHPAAPSAGWVLERHQVPPPPPPRRLSLFQVQDDHAAPRRSPRRLLPPPPGHRTEAAQVWERRKASWENRRGHRWVQLLVPPVDVLRLDPHILPSAEVIRWLNQKSGWDGGLRFRSSPEALVPLNWIRTRSGSRSWFCSLMFSLYLLFISV